MWANLPDKLAAAAHRLAGVALEQGDALALIPRYDQPDTVIYCDPQYAGPWRLEPGTGYRLDQAEHLWPRLVEVLSGVEHAAVILSGYPCDAAKDLGWTRLHLAHKRSVTARSGSTLAAGAGDRLDQPRRRGLATEPVLMTRSRQLDSIRPRSMSEVEFAMQLDDRSRRRIEPPDPWPRAVGASRSAPGGARR